MKFVLFFCTPFLDPDRLDPSKPGSRRSRNATNLFHFLGDFHRPHEIRYDVPYRKESLRHLVRDLPDFTAGNSGGDRDLYTSTSDHTVGDELDFTSSSCRLDISAKEGGGGGGGSRLDIRAPAGDELADSHPANKRDSAGLYEGGGSQLRLVSFEEQEDVGGGGGSSSGEVLAPKSTLRHWGDSSAGMHQ
jgi:hypothetical protein